MLMFMGSLFDQLNSQPAKMILGLSVFLVPLAVIIILFIMSDYSTSDNKEKKEIRRKYYEEKEKLARSKDCKLCGARWDELTEMEHAELKKEIYHERDCPWYRP